MNWTRFQTYGLSPEKSFEMLCNQLFENWCREEYGFKLLSFDVVNGSGGDGGVEAYAVLVDGSIVGVQAKWFYSSISDKQFTQIQKSINTAKKVRSGVKKYIVCIPRDLASETARGTYTEKKKWEKLVEKTHGMFPDLSIELWNDTRITKELQKALSAGIQKYWFENSEINESNITYAFEKARTSWLSTKYVPDLNVPGKIEKVLMNCLGDFTTREQILEQFSSIIDLCKKYNDASAKLISLIEKSDYDFSECLIQSKKIIEQMQLESERICDWIKNEHNNLVVFDESKYYFDAGIHKLRQSKIEYKYFHHYNEVISILRKLSNIDYYHLFEKIRENINNKCILFLGNPGTGKTQGVSAYANKLINQHYHIPVIIQARGIPEAYTWRDMVIKALGLSESWSEEDIWQALISAANRNRYQDTYLKKQICINPKILIIVDGVDESTTINKWIERIKTTETITNKYSQIRFCFTSRPAPFSLPIENSYTIRLKDDGDTPVHKLFEKYTSAYKISLHNCQWLKYAINTPITLKLFCELYQDKSVSISKISEVSMSALWRKKIELIQMEFDQKENAPRYNQYILRAIRILSECFMEKEKLERDEIFDAFIHVIKINEKWANKILDYLESYGVVSSICKKGIGIEPDIYEYYTGIQGYFDYASAIYILKQYESPELIDFSKYKNIDKDTLYSLAIISMQQYKYLITHNPTINAITHPYYAIEEIEFYAIQHADIEEAVKYKEQCLEYMKKGANEVVKIVNHLVLPLSRIKGHPLGTSLLDEFLNTYKKPAQRDIIWSIPPLWLDADGEKWGKHESIELYYDKEDVYYLCADDTYEGIAIVYAWMLSCLDNRIRKEARKALMTWAEKAPLEFYQLFLHFSKVNDPQVLSDLYAILMCLVYICNNRKLVKEVSDWIISNVLDSSVIDKNRDISVRYYCIAIIEKAKMFGLYSDDYVKDFLPPYKAQDGAIKIQKEAFSGTRMNGYSAIDYDLARYVLVDHFNNSFNSFKVNQLDAFLKQYGKNHPVCRGITSEQFIISAAYAYVRHMGWNEREFYNLSKQKSGYKREGVDLSIRASYYPATHGAKSTVMTVCEKYVWAARNCISGFLSDRVLFGEKQIQITDYNTLDDFIIPFQEIHVIDPNNIPEDRPWYIPEPHVIDPGIQIDSQQSLKNYIQNSPSVDWKRWINIDNGGIIYSIPHRHLLALSGFSCFVGLSGIETCLFLNSIVLPTTEMSKFLEYMRNKEIYEKVCEPTDWDGSVESRCYISPLEICWFPWKEHYDGIKKEFLPSVDIHSAIDGCCYNFSEYGDVYFSLPSKSIRIITGIVDTDGYLFFDKNKEVVAEYSVSGEQMGTAQNCVIIDSEKLKMALKKNELSIVWFAREMRRENGLAREKYGNIYAEKNTYSIIYYSDNELMVETLLTEYRER